MEYMILLFNQFNESKGYDKKYLNSQHYINEFIYWLKDLKELSSIYLKFANYEGINLSEDDFVELNKGRYDSINKTVIVSPFASSMNIQNKKLVVYQGEPYIICDSKIKKGQVADTYTTFNAYNYYYLNNLDKLHNSGIRICYGIFGKNTDLNREIKIKRFNDFILKLNDECVFDIENINDNYFGIVFSNRKIKQLELKK